VNQQILKKGVIGSLSEVSGIPSTLAGDIMGKRKMREMRKWRKMRKMRKMRKWRKMRNWRKYLEVSGVIGIEE